MSKNGLYTPKKAAEAWEKLFNENLKERGLPVEYEQYIRLKTKAAKAFKKAYSGKPWELIKAKKHEIEAENLLSGEPERIEKVCATLSEKMGFPVRANKTSVNEFHGYVEALRDN